MNFKKIQENYPLAFDFAQRWWGKGENNTALVQESIGCTPKSPRDLYTLFDEQGIYVEITIETKGRASYDILDSKCQYWYSQDEPTIYNSRTEAETEAFTKAFEILEIKLKGEK